MVVNIITEIPGAVMQAWPALVQTFQNLGQDIITKLCGGTEMNMGDILDKGVEAISGFANKIFENLPMMIESAGQMISKLVQGIMQNLPTIIEKGAVLVGKIAQGFIQNLPAIVSALAKMFENIVSTIASNLPNMLQQGIEILGKIIAGLIRAIPDVVSAIGQINETIKNTLKNVDWAQLGKDIINGIIAGLYALGSSIGNALKDIVTQGLDAAKKKLGIASPSKVFRDEVGKWIPAGIAVGIEANTDEVTGAIDDMKAQALSTSQMQISTSYGDSAIRAREEKMDAILGLLATYLPDCAAPTVIDGESMMETINTQLGLGVI
jgi:phage-related protein